MKKVILLTVAVAMFIALPLSSVFAYESFLGKSELIQWNRAKAYNGYTLWDGRNLDPSKTILMDMEGQVVHTWPYARKSQLYEDGTMRSRLENPHYDWDGNIIFEWEPDPDTAPLDSSTHHDSWYIYNPKLGKNTYIAIFYSTLTQEEIIAAGGDPSIDYTQNRRNERHDGMLEVDPDTGEIIWMWRFIDHTIQDRNAAWPCYVGAGNSISDYPGKIDIFWKTDQVQPDGDEGVVEDWQHCNSLNYNEDLDLLAINAKHWSEFYVIDHGNTFVPGDPATSFQLAASDAGDFIYRFGNPSAYKQGDPPGFRDEGDQQMYGSHNIQWIKKRAWTDGPELPGAGHFLIFNNGCYNPGPNHSEVIEINPFLDAEGNDTGWYVNPPDAGYDSDNDSNQIVWLYESERPDRGTSFYARHISGCERQPNGNTLIMAGTQGHMFEVTEDGEVVWEYQEPVNQNFYRFDGDSTSGSFRVHRYSPDYPGLAGRDLTPGSTLTGRIPVTVVPDIEPIPITGWGIPPGTSSEAGAGDVGEAGEGGY